MSVRMRTSKFTNSHTHANANTTLTASLHAMPMPFYQNKSIEILYVILDFLFNFFLILNLIKFIGTKNCYFDIDVNSLSICRHQDGSTDYQGNESASNDSID